MSSNAAWLGTLALAIVALMAISSGPAAGTFAPHSVAGFPVAPSGALPTTSTSPPESATHDLAPAKALPANVLAADRIKAEAAAQHVVQHTFYPPNLLMPPVVHDGLVVAPGYTQAPDPAGLADYGIMNSTGTATPYHITTTSYRADVDLASVSPYYLANGIPDGFSSQLNVVLRNVTLFGQSNYNFWTQNVIFYDAYSSQLEIENNIWNFSEAPIGPQALNTFYYGLPGYTNGSDDPSIGYYAAGVGPYNGITTPYSVVLYINATTLVNLGTAYTEVDFAFDLYNGAGQQVMSDMYDRVLFNNTAGDASIPQAQFYVDGSTLTPTGFIPYDAEIMLGGPGGGSTATFNDIDATMTLQHWDATADAYVNEPATWSAGSETGETSVGIADYWTADGVAHLGPGPEFVQPLWNSSATSVAGAAVLTGTVTPSNSWAFVTDAGAYNSSFSAWAPLPAAGPYTWDLTAGTYTARFMLSDHTPATSAAETLTTTGSTTLNENLPGDAAAGVYTPLYADGNAELAAISSNRGGGAGTEADPYLLDNNEIGALSPEFATANDYLFPSFTGISLVGITDYVEIANPAPFTVDYWGSTAAIAQDDQVPNVNDLGIWVFESSDISIVGGTMGGWTSSNQDGFPYADVLLWNTTFSLVADLTFNVVTEGIFAYGGGNNTFTGNTFLDDDIAGDFMGAFAAPYFLLPSGYPLALNEEEGNDTILNNYFDTTYTAFETDTNVWDDLYLSTADAYSNNWNLSGAVPVPADTVFTYNGLTFSGSITGSSTVCGNWWYDYNAAFGLPYDEYGLIITGGDYCPQGPTLFAVDVSEAGLSSSQSWGAYISPTTPGSPGYGASFTEPAGTAYTADLPAGTYEISYNTVTGYNATPAYDIFEIEPNGVLVNSSGVISGEEVDYVAGPGNVVFSAGGFTAAGTSWSVSVDSMTLTGSTLALNTTLPAGSYSYTIGVVGGYTATPSSGTVIIGTGNTTTVDIWFTPSAPAPGTLAGSVTPKTASVTIDGSPVTLTSGAFTLTEPAGVYALEATLAGYFPYFNNASVASGKTTTVTIVMDPTIPPVGADGTLSVEVTPTDATVWVNGSTVALAGGSYSGSYAPGVVSLEVTAKGYYPYYNNVSVHSAETTPVTVVLTAIPSSTSPTTTSPATGISGTAWAIIGGLAILVVLLLVLLLWIAGRRNSPPGSAPAVTPSDPAPEPSPAPKTLKNPPTASSGATEESSPPAAAVSAAVSTDDVATK